MTTKKGYKRLNYAVSLNFTMEMDRRWDECHIDPTDEDLMKALTKHLADTPIGELALETYDVFEVQE